MSKKTRDEKKELAKQEKKEARNKLTSFERFELKRDTFFIHGWGDEANICWTEPYMEVGERRATNWKYNIKEWLDGIVINKNKMHFINLVENESNIRRFEKRGHKKIDIDGDKTYYYICFYQFAELLKKKIKETCGDKPCDLVCHSMGGLDAVAAIALDEEDDDKDFINSPYLRGVNRLITVATPHRGSPKADAADSFIAKLLFNNSIYVRAQGINMSAKREFITKINTLKIRKKLIDRIHELHEFGGERDIVVPQGYWKIKTDDISTNKIVEYKPMTSVAHSQKEGITQDERLILEVMKILAS